MLRTALDAFRPRWPRLTSYPALPIRTVTIAGLTGALGPALLSALCEAGFTVQALTQDVASARAAAAAGMATDGGAARSSNNNNEVTFRSTDYHDPAALVALLRGQDAVVSCLGDSAAAVAAQRALIAAAVEAGVRRFVPSEFGADTTHGRVRENPFFGAKIEHQDLLKTLAEQHPWFSWSILITGPFLDWGLSVVPFIIDVGNMSAQVYDDGIIPFSVTRTATVGRAVAATLQRANRTRNRVLFIHEAVVTQNELIAEALIAAATSTTTPSPHSPNHATTSFTHQPVSTAALEHAAWAAYRQHQQQNDLLTPSPPPNPASPASPTIVPADLLTWILPFINLSIWAADNRGHFARVDNALLGLPAPLQRRAKREMIAREVRKAREGFLAAAITDAQRDDYGLEEGKEAKEKLAVDEVELHQPNTAAARAAAADKAYQGGLQRLIGVVASSG